MAYEESKDPYSAFSNGISSFGRKSTAVTPDDSNDFTSYSKAVVCLTSGNISIVPVENADGDTVDFVAVAAGFIPPFQVRRVMSTGTTATVATVE